MSVSVSVYLMYEALHDMTPLYITQFLSEKNVPRQIMFNDQHMCEAPLTNLAIKPASNSQTLVHLLLSWGIQTFHLHLCQQKKDSFQQYNLRSSV